MTTPLTLIVDDEPDILELLEITLNQMDIQCCKAADINSAKMLLSQHSFQLCLTDMKLPDGDGLQLLTDIQNSQSPMPVAVITAHGNMDIAIKAMKMGAFDFISKPVDLNSLRQLVQKAIKLSSPSRDTTENGRQTLLGNSEIMQQVRTKIKKLARSQAPVYISGESGSGKELAARLIHQQSPRRENAFIAVNCGAIPPELMESEFFGHKKGSFTGASNDKKGLFQAADGGTLFLDEVADLPQSLQVKLLRAIQEKKIRPVGEYHEIPVDVRLLSASHKDLNKMVQEGSFRQDLFYRINVIDLNIAPLRQRAEDIPQLVDYIISKLSSSLETKPTLSCDALTALKKYQFPGNVRELENILERAFALYEGDTINCEDLNLPINQMDSQDITDYDPNQGPLEEYLEDIEKQAINTALEENKWNKTAAAKQLGLSFRSLRYRLKKLGLE